MYEFNYKFCVRFIIFYLSVFTRHKYVEGGALPLTSSNIDNILADNDLVVINFYADWCPFSNSLAPIYDKAADMIHDDFGKDHKIVMGKVNCDVEASIVSRYHITKYPTLKIFRNGLPAKREYRGQRSPEAFHTFVKKELSNPIKEFHSLKELKKELEQLDDKKRIIIGYYDTMNVPEYDNFKRVAMSFREDCQFYVGFGEASQAMHPKGEPIVVFRSDKAVSVDKDETFTGNLSIYDELKAWAQGKCVPLVREITFENAEELTEEGLPFLILFHNTNDHASVKKYKEVVANNLMDEKQNINFLTADGVKFEHPLHHLGKKKSDLPLIAIDSFRHMYLFSDFKDIDKPGKLKQFLHDLYSGKLHREFHYGPDPSENEISTDNMLKTPTSPPESTFKKLAPSKNRYTILHKDEL